MSSPSSHVLVIEDDAPIRRGVVDALRFAGFEVTESADGESGEALALECGPDLVLLDVLLPKRNGFDVLQSLRRARPTLPIIMLTARGSEDDRVRGLRDGADDYVVKPFSAKELLARIDAVLRRSSERPADVGSIQIGAVHVDLRRREVTCAGRTVALTDREADILRYLAGCRGRAVDRRELLQSVWGLNPRGLQTRTVDMHVARLREKLGDDPGDPKVIITVRAKGYMLAEGAECRSDA